MAVPRRHGPRRDTIRASGTPFAKDRLPAPATSDGDEVIVRHIETKARRDVTVTLMEAGARWPGYVLHPHATESDSLVIAQAMDETPTDFAARAIRRISALGASGCAVPRATLAAGDEVAPGVLDARCRIAATLAGLASFERPRAVVLAGHERLSDEGRGHLASLAADLSEQFGSDGPSVRLVLEPPRDLPRSARAEAR